MIDRQPRSTDFLPIDCGRRFHRVFGKLRRPTSEGQRGVDEPGAEWCAPAWKRLPSRCRSVRPLLTNLSAGSYLIHVRDLFRLG